VLVGGALRLQGQLLRRRRVHLEAALDQHPGSCTQHAAVTGFSTGIIGTPSKHRKSIIGTPSKHRKKSAMAANLTPIVLEFICKNLKKKLQ
jgi:hypothetical protein